MEVAVGFSAGVDSSVLLNGMSRLRDELGVRRLRALHVHHGLMPGAESWATHAAGTARALGVEFVCLRVSARPRLGESPEAAARDARYRALADVLSSGEVLFLAQHADDQVETFLIQLLRGSGPCGLSAMAPERELGQGLLCRPFLQLTRAQILDCARDWHLSWIEDESNRDPRFLRARVRHELLPLLRSIRPGVEQVLAGNASLQSRAWSTLELLAAADLGGCEGSLAGTLSRAALERLPGPRRAEVLRLWLRRRRLRPPGRRRLLELDRQLVTAARDRRIRVAWDGAQVVGHGDDVYVLRDDAVFVPAADERHSWHWAADRPLVMAHGTLHASRSDAGIGHPGPFEVRIAQTGVRCRPQGHRHSCDIRELLRRHRIPPWERSGLPLLYVDGRLAAVADVMVCEGFQARAGRPALAIDWQPRWREENDYRRGAGTDS